MKTNGSSGCYLYNFTANKNYSVRLRCNVVTGASGGSNERCRWDNISIVAEYIDIQPPKIVVFNTTPTIVNYSQTINFTANITDKDYITLVLSILRYILKLMFIQYMPMIQATILFLTARKISP